MRQLAYFIEFLNLTGLWSRWQENCPLSYASPNAPSKADVLGTWMLSILAGHKTITALVGFRKLRQPAFPWRSPWVWFWVGIYWFCL